MELSEQLGWFDIYLPLTEFSYTVELQWLADCILICRAYLSYCAVCTILNNNIPFFQMNKFFQHPQCCGRAASQIVIA